MKVRIPNIKGDPELTKFLTSLVKEIEDTQKDLISKITANNSVLFQAPNGGVWRVSVNNAGAVITDKVYDPI